MQVPGLEPGPDNDSRLRRRLLIGLGATAGVLLVGGVALLTLPVPPLDDYLGGQVRSRAATLLSCPGAAPARVEVDGPMLPQLVSGRLQELRVTVPDVALVEGRTSTLAVTLRGVTGLQDATPVAESLETTTTLAYRDLPAPAIDPAATVTATGDGRLEVALTPPRSLTDTVPVVTTLDLRLASGAVVATPKAVSVLGADVPLDAVAGLVGGERTFPLPAAPSGLRFTSVRAEPDGVHVGLEGAVTTPLSALPRTVGGNAVRYRVRDGLLGISTTQSVLGLFEVPVTLWTAPTLRSGQLVLEPRTVEALGQNRPADDPIAATALAAVDRSSLTRALPTLPAGVTYASAAVDAAGLTVGVGGGVVQPFSTLPAPDGLPGATYGATDGRLTVTTTGLPAGAPTRVTLVVTPTVEGTTLRLVPQTMTLLGTQFDATTTLRGLGDAVDLSYPLPTLHPGLSYTGLTATPDGLRVTVQGTDVALSRDLLGAPDCSAT